MPAPSNDNRRNLHPGANVGALRTAAGEVNLSTTEISLVNSNGFGMVLRAAKWESQTLKQIQENTSHI